MSRNPSRRSAPILPLTIALVLAGGAAAQAGVRAPLDDADGIPCDPILRSSFELSPAPVGCQYRFGAGGDLDELTVIVTVRDCFDTPIAGCGIQATLVPNAGTVEFCACEPTVQVVPTNADGAVQFRYSRIGGRGSLSVALTAVCSGQIPLETLDLDFTSPDLSGSCEPGASTTIIDLAYWSAGLSAYQVESDLNCDGAIGILDLALWAKGLGIGCP